MKSFQDFMDDASQFNEAAGDASAFRERQRARQSAMISSAKSKAEKYRTHGVRGADKKSQRRLNARNRALSKAAGQLGSAAFSAVKAGVKKLKAMKKKKEGDQ